MSASADAQRLYLLALRQRGALVAQQEQLEEQEERIIGHECLLEHLLTLSPEDARRAIRQVLAGDESLLEWEEAA